MKDNFTLSKNEILRSKISINSLMNNGKLVKQFPIFLSYETVKSDNPEVKILFAISKKKQKLAVKRNQIKRKLKEAYRLNKLSLYKSCLDRGVSMNVMIIQVDGRDIPLANVEKKMIKALNRLIEQESKTDD